MNRYFKTASCPSGPLETPTYTSHFYLYPSHLRAHRVIGFLISVCLQWLSHGTSGCMWLLPTTVGDCGSNYWTLTLFPLQTRLHQEAPTSYLDAIREQWAFPEEFCIFLILSRVPCFHFCHLCNLIFLLICFPIFPVFCLDFQFGSCPVVTLCKSRFLGKSTRTEYARRDSSLEKFPRRQEFSA